MEGDGARPHDVVVYGLARRLAITHANRLDLVSWGAASARRGEITSDESLVARATPDCDEDEDENPKSEGDQSCSERGEIPLAQLAESQR